MFLIIFLKFLIFVIIAQVTLINKFQSLSISLILSVSTQCGFDLCVSLLIVINFTSFIKNYFTNKMRTEKYPVTGIL